MLALSPPALALSFSWAFHAILHSHEQVGDHAPDLCLCLGLLHPSALHIGGSSSLAVLPVCFVGDDCASVFLLFLSLDAEVDLVLCARVSDSCRVLELVRSRPLLDLGLALLSSLLVRHSLFRLFLLMPGDSVRVLPVLLDSW